jgi:glycosyltransferase involved in cell wall biosynthesis
MKVAAIIPAHNEAERVARVLETVVATPGIDRVILVDDGSKDNTSAVARTVKGVHVERLDVNRGKGGAMLRGATLAADADVLLFLDADLIGLKTAHVASLIEPVVTGKADMALGKFTGGRGATDLAQYLVPFITGQRAIRRPLFQCIPDLDRVGFGIEMAITLHVKAAKRPVATVFMQGVTHPMKEEKLGFIRGARARAKMYAEMAGFTIGYFCSGKARHAKRVTAALAEEPAPVESEPDLAVHAAHRQ